ncbi:amidohydrolase family protein [Mucilaginibacter sp. RCC_168]|uniref:amidohydrolase family protein n=1 Tax=Mucilaginibacter sp. RCC_168 TaxID=3239221 RepID=UPI003525DCB1
MEVQESVALSYIKKAPARFAYIASFEMKGWQHPNWFKEVSNGLKRSIEQGAVGVKIWKNIGMEILKPDDKSFLMIDDPFFDPLFLFLSENKIPVLTHLGEPRNCWLPLEEMTSERNKAYYTKNPEFHAYLHPEIPSYERQIAARDYLMVKYPELTLVGAHLGSLEWSYEELAKRFDQYSNFYVDLSSRLGHLQMQSVKDYDGVRDFFIKYADRIMYGTDAYNNPEKLISSLINDWKYFTTNKYGESTEVKGAFKGIDLPENILYQLYYANAKRIYPALN